jgi:hypothetical protein
MKRSRLVCAFTAGLLALPFAARSQFAALPPGAIRSASGQFSVSVAPDPFPYYRRPAIGTNTDIVQLQAPLLAVSAERFRAALWRIVGLAPNSPWSGKIFLDLRPTRSGNEVVSVVSQSFLRGWNYRLELPDQLTRDRYARAFSAVLLLEIANRHAPFNRHATELPPWLVIGLARQVLELDNGAAILSTPTKLVNGFAQTRLDEERHGIDPLAAARRVLQNSPALTFDQLCWPSAAQLNDTDGGGYAASAQLFVHELLELKNGAAKLRELLAQLPTCENWQTAFFAAFKEDFSRPLAAEKWWALRVVNFAARDPGPQWTAAFSRTKLDALLAVPVAIRYASNALPVRAEISLQLAVQNFAPPRQTEILQTKLRDLQLVQFRLAAPVSALAEGYIAALADFLGGPRAAAARRYQTSADELIKILDDLDARRRELGSQLEQNALPATVLRPPGST